VRRNMIKMKRPRTGETGRSWGMRQHARKPSKSSVRSWLGAVLVTYVPELVPFHEALYRPARVLSEHLLPFFERFRLATELAQDREVVDIGHEGLLIRGLSDQLQRAFVVAHQVVIEV
jgi:hypothetical protein